MKGMCHGAKLMRIRCDSVKSPEQARDELEFLQTKLDCCLVIDGESLQVRRCVLTCQSLQSA